MIFRQTDNVMKIAGREKHQPVDFHLPGGQPGGGGPDATKMGQIVRRILLGVVRQYPVLKSLLPVYQVHRRSLSEGQPRA